VTFESNIFGLITSQIEQKNPFWQVLSVDRSIHNKVMLHTNTKWASKTKIKTLLTTFLNIFFSIFNTNSTIIIFVNRGEGLLRILVSVVVGVCDFFFANIHQTLKVR